jgi:VanZ family protein
MTPDHSFKNRALAWLPSLACPGLIFLLSAQPGDAFPKLILDKLISTASHFTVYAILMTLLVMALHRGSGMSATRARLSAFVLVAVYALSDEYHQSFVPGRTATLFDWLADVAGASLIWIVLIRRERRQDSSR